MLNDSVLTMIILDLAKRSRNLALRALLLLEPKAGLPRKY